MKYENDGGENDDGNKTGNSNSVYTAKLSNTFIRISNKMYIYEPIKYIPVSRILRIFSDSYDRVTLIWTASKSFKNNKNT